MRHICFSGLFIGYFLCLITTHASVPLQDQLRAAKHDSTRLRLYSELALYYYNKDNLDSAAYYADRGIRLAQKVRSTRYNSNFYTRQAYRFRFEKHYDQAIHSAQLAIHFGKKHQQYADTEAAGYLLAIIYADKAFNIGSMQVQMQTIRQVFENIRFSNKYRSFTLIGHNYSLLSAIYKDNGNDSLAYLYLKKELSYSPKLENTTQKLNFLMNNFIVSLYQNRNKKANDWLAQILSLPIKKEDESVYHYALFEVIATYIKFNEFDEAFRLIKMVKNDAKMMAKLSVHWKFQMNKALATIYLYRKNYKPAQQAHEAALFFSKKEPLPFGDRLSLLINQQKLFEYQKRFEEALVLNKRIHAMQDSLTSEQFNFELAASEERLEYENKERNFSQQLKIQQLQNQRNTQRLKQSQYILWATLLVLSLLSIVVLIIARQMKQIKKQSAALKELNANKDRLFGIIGHDLRSPVIHLQMNLTAILNKISATSAELTPLVSQQLSRTTGLLSTLDNLLYWSITQREKISVNLQAAPIHDLIEEALEWLEQSRLQTGVTVYTDIDASHQIFVDENHMRIILRNLIQNAYKFTPSGGQVRLSARAAENTIELSIQDTGPGFTEAAQNDKKRGTQLGLKLVRELMQANHSTIQIESSPKGTMIQLSFPKA